jgi:hypothetical protein
VAYETTACGVGVCATTGTYPWRTWLYATARKRTRGVKRCAIVAVAYNMYTMGTQILYVMDGLFPSIATMTSWDGW